MIPAELIPHVRVGDLVTKCKGDYPFPGEVRAVFTNAKGQWRFVIERHETRHSVQLEAMPMGLLHIFNAEQLELSDRKAVLLRLHNHEAISGDTTSPEPETVRGELAKLIKRILERSDEITSAHVIERLEEYVNAVEWLAIASFCGMARISVKFNQIDHLLQRLQR